MRFSASKAALLTKCKFPFRADMAAGVANDQHRQASEDARCGSALHRCAEWMINGHTPDLVMAAREFDVEDQIPRLARTWLHMHDWIATRKEQPLSAEVKLSLDLDKAKARILTAEGDRNYADAGEREIPMTIDVLNVSFSTWRIPSFRDWKTGYSADGYWPQIAVNALAVAWWLKTEHPLLWDEFQAVEGGILHATGAGIDESRVRVFTKDDLDAIARDIHGDLAAIPTAAPTPGDHCIDLYCGAFGTCPAILARVEAVGQLIPAEKLARRDQFTLSPAIHSAEHAAWAIECLRTYEAYAKQVKAAVEAFVGDGEYPLSEGGTLKKTYRDVPRLSTPALIALARSKGANDEDIAACTNINHESAGIRVVGRKR